MKRYLFMAIILSIFCIEGLAHAKWYTFDENNQAIAKTQYEPDVQDLNLRNEFAVFSKSDIRLTKAEYRGGKVKAKIKSQSDKDAEDAKAVHDAKHEADFQSAKAKLLLLNFTSDEVHALAGR